MIRDTWGPQISRDDWPTKYEPRVGCFMNFVETTRPREVKKVGEFSSRVLTRTLTTPSRMEVRYLLPTAGKELSYNVDMSSNALPTEGGGFQLPCGFPRAPSAKLRPTLQAWVVGQKLAGHYTSFRHGSGALRAACPDSKPRRLWGGSAMERMAPTRDAVTSGSTAWTRNSLCVTIKRWVHHVVAVCYYASTNWNTSRYWIWCRSYVDRNSFVSGS